MYPIGSINFQYLFVFWKFRSFQRPPSNGYCGIGFSPWHLQNVIKKDFVLNNFEQFKFDDNFFSPKRICAIWVSLGVFGTLRLIINTPDKFCIGISVFFYEKHIKISDSYIYSIPDNLLNIIFNQFWRYFPVCRTVFQMFCNQLRYLPTRFN